MKKIREFTRDFIDDYFGKILLIVVIVLIILYRKPIYKFQNDWSDAIRKEHFNE